MEDILRKHVENDLKTIANNYSKKEIISETRLALKNLDELLSKKSENIDKEKAVARLEVLLEVMKEANIVNGEAIPNAVVAIAGDYASKDINKENGK